MAFDGATLSLIAGEIRQRSLGAKVDKIYLPAKDELVLVLHGKKGNDKLLLSASPATSRIHYTGVAVENPSSPPMFCMLLRKHLGGGRLVDVRQFELDRILFIDFECINEMRDVVTNTLCIEVMGRHSNIVLLNEEQRVVDAIKRVGLETSSVRQILPGIRYELPPAQDKLNLVQAELCDAVDRMRSGKDGELSKVIQWTLMGFSPILAREAAHYATRGASLRQSELSEEHWKRLEFYLGRLKQELTTALARPTAVIQPDGKPMDFSFVEIHQYPVEYATRSFPTLDEMLDYFYSERDRVERVKARSSDLIKLLVNTLERTERRLAVQRQELAESKNRELLKIQGDLISANLYNIQKGQTVVHLENFYDEDMATIEIALDPMLTPPQNAQKYYGEYRKADTAEKKLKELIQEGVREYEYLESVLDALMRTSGETELGEIRQELYEQRYLRHSNKKKGNAKKLPPLRYRSSDGFTILVGRNNYSNDALTLKASAKSDLWLHVQKIPGSHTVVVTQGAQVPDSTLEEAALLAAYHSKARDSANVPVDYALIRHVKKPQGAKPGMVIYDHYKTLYVTPREERIHVIRGNGE